MIFAFGARRSGTYWLQRILASHPDVAEIPAETHLFSHGIAPLMESFHHGARGSPQTGAMYADREQLLDKVRDLCDSAFAGYLEGGERFLVERTPLHILYARLIGEVYPDAHLVQIVRDGRDVAHSMLGHSWGPASVADAAREWRSAVRAARSARSHAGYVEVRYEALLADPPGEIRDLYRAIGLEVGPAIVEAAVREAEIPVNVDPYRVRVATAKWKQELSPDQVREFEQVAGDLLADLGYGLATAPGSGTSGEAEPDIDPPWKDDPEQAAKLLERLLALAREGRPHAAAELLLLLGRGEGPGRSERVGPPGAGARLRGAGARLLRRRSSGSRRDGLGAPWEDDARAAVRLVDELLTFAQEGRAEAAAGLLAPDASVTIIGDGERLEARGDEARETLARALAGDEAIRGRQLRGDVIAGEPTAAYVLAYEAPDGTRAERLLLVTAKAGRISRLTLHRLGVA